MRKLFGFLGVSLLSFGVLVTANAAESGRGGSITNAANGGRAGALSSQRMLTMPVSSINAIGNFGGDNQAIVNDSGKGGGNGGGGNILPPEPARPAVPEKPGCPDGGIENSEYTVEMCMNDVLSCVNSGALPNGLNDMFNSDLRNSIMNGMNLCAAQVDKCVDDVRKKCNSIYHSFTDVWIDFNSRKVQPEYYAFVLRKTGLTPYQAENTCALLDVNTYGASFGAVANNGKTTSEYNNKINAYNGQGPDKDKPQGVIPNYGNGGVDGQRGHYARWDAINGDCLVRVAAYNKDSLITNDYGWILNLGDDKVAEVWQNAGTSFTCNKNLFEFSLMNNTATAAIWGVGGGAVAGAGVGAIAGHGKRDFDCGNNGHLELLYQELHAANKIAVLNQYLNDKILTNEITDAQCTEIVQVYNSYAVAKTELDNCKAAAAVEGAEIPEKCNGFNSITKLVAYPNGQSVYCENPGNGCLDMNKFGAEVASLGSVFGSKSILKTGESGNMLASTLTGAGIGAATGGVVTAITAFVEKNNINCRVGDGLEKVGFGKSYTIGTLNDFYVKWKLSLPDTVSPTAQVVDCYSWKNACSAMKNIKECTAASINYKPYDAPKVTLINAACAVSGSVCIENYIVAKTYGACE